MLNASLSLRSPCYFQVKVSAALIGPLLFVCPHLTLTRNNMPIDSNLSIPCFLFVIFFGIRDFSITHQTRIK
jgi:hypothetical protein